MKPPVGKRWFPMIADRLDQAGYGDVAKHYRRASDAHQECAERLEREAGATDVTTGACAGRRTPGP